MKSAHVRSAAILTLFLAVVGSIENQTPAWSAAKIAKEAETGANAEEKSATGPVGQEAAGGNNPAVASAPPSVVQVSGNINNFTVSAQHANVLSLLKLVFDQAHRQFVPDGSVTGDVTFALTGQRFETVLNAICKQAFLRYEIDRNGVYQFLRDEQALRSLIMRTQLINGALQEQLGRMGYAVPRSIPASGLGTGGFGGGRALNSSDLNKANSSKEQIAGGAVGQAAGGSALSEQSRGRGEASGQNNVTRYRSAPAAVDQGAPALNRVLAPNALGMSDLASQGGQGPQRQSGLNQEAGVNAGNVPGNAYAFPSQAIPSGLNLENSAQYQMFLKQNNFVRVNTQDRDVAVRDVLLDAGRQAGVAIWIDPAVPRGADFVINGYITPRPLAEVLNILAYKARLDWRWINNNIFVTTTPQLQLYLRGALLPGQNGGITVLPAPSRGRAASSAEKKAEDKSEPADKDKPKEKKD